MTSILMVAVLGLHYRWMPLEHLDLTSAQTAHGPDVTIIHPRLEHFDEAGKLAWRVTGDKLRYFEGNDYAEVDEPRALMPQQEKTSSKNTPDSEPDPWHGRGNLATLQKNVQVLDLMGDAEIWNRESNIRSRHLRLYLDRQLVETNKAATIRRQGSTARALGLQADLINETLSLPAQVKEIHDVAASPLS